MEMDTVIIPETPNLSIISNELIDLEYEVECQMLSNKIPTDTRSTLTNALIME